MVVAEGTVVLGREVNLVVVGTGRRTRQIVAVAQSDGIEVGHIQIAVVLTAHGGIEVVAAAVAVHHLIKGVRRAVLIALVGVDALRVGETEFQTFQNLTPTEIVADASVDVQVGVHIALVVAVVLKNVEVIVLVLVLLTVAHTVGGDAVVFHVFGHVIGTGEQQVVVLLGVRASHFYKRGVLLAVVAGYSKVGTQPLAYLHIHTGAEVPAVVVQTAQVTFLVEVADAGKVVHLVGGTAHVHTVLHCRTGLPVLVQKIVVERLHGFQLVGLEQLGRLVQRGVSGVGGFHGIEKTAVVVSAQHLRT